MLSITTDESRNVLRLEFSGRIRAADLTPHSAKLNATVASLPAGFRLLTDLSRLDATDSDCVPWIDALMDLCNSAGVSKVVRIIPDPRKDIGLNILSLFHYRSRIPILTCKTAAEADQLLNE